MTQELIEQVGVQRLRGVGPQLSQKLEKMGITTVQDLLFHLPLRYVDKTKISTHVDAIKNKKR